MAKNILLKKYGKKYTFKKSMAKIYFLKKYGKVWQNIYF
jgi:hypothetical protein